MEWHEDPDTLVAVARWACDEGEMPGWYSGREQWLCVLDFFEKPWHYGVLYDQWRVADVLEQLEQKNPALALGIEPLRFDGGVRVYDDPDPDGFRDYSWERAACGACDREAVATLDNEPICFTHLEGLLDV